MSLLVAYNISAALNLFVLGRRSLDWLFRQFTAYFAALPAIVFSGRAFLCCCIFFSIVGRSTYCDAPVALTSFSPFGGRPMNLLVL